jgi:hypothetical protein
MIAVELRLNGKKQIPSPGLSIPVPPSPGDGTLPFTLRYLISQIVNREVQAFGVGPDDR